MPQHSWKKLSLHAVRSAIKIIQMKRDIEHNPPTNIWAKLLVVRKPVPPHWKTSYIFSRWDVVCLYIHWVVQNTKQHPFLSMSVVFTQSASFFFSFITSSIIAKESLSLACPSCLRFALLVINLVAPLTSFLSSSLPLLLPFVYFVTFGSFQPCSRE